MPPLQNGGYVQPPPIKRQFRDPHADWWDKQERRNYGEPCHEDFDLLGMFTPYEYTWVKPGKGLLQIGAFIATTFGVLYLVKLTYPDKPAYPREFEFGGLEIELGGPGARRVSYITGLLVRGHELIIGRRRENQTIQSHTRKRRWSKENEMYICVRYRLLMNRTGLDPDDTLHLGCKGVDMCMRCGLARQCLSSGAACLLYSRQLGVGRFHLRRERSHDTTPSRFPHGSSPLVQQECQVK